MRGQSTLNRCTQQNNEQVWTFAVIADSHVNPTDDSSSSPWEVNRLANARLGQVVNELNKHQPDFVIHLGDMIHPVPAQSTYATAARNFRGLVDQLEAPLYLVPGNHDVGDKPLEWTPAEIVTEEHISLYEQHFGSSYYSFDHQGCHFVIVNAQLINTGYRSEALQEAWLQNDLRTNAGRRMFVFMHYPPYILDPCEPGHYDNLDEPGRSWLLSQIEENGVEAVFAGHVHNFFYNRYGETDLYAVPSTSFVRSDYSEFGRIAPEDADGGRNDIGKLGYFVVEMYPDGHVPLIHRTYGATCQDPSPSIESRVGPNGPSRRLSSPIGIDLRHSWAEVVEIPYTGGVDEFARKRARNDYPLLGLWEMGIRVLRLPLADLQSAETGQRVHDLGQQGHRFIPFCFGLPSAAQVAALQSSAEFVDALEIITADSVQSWAPEVAELRQALNVPIFFSKLRGHEDIVASGERYAHVLNHGYRVSELLIMPTWQLPETNVDGVSVRIARNESPIESVASLAQIVKDKPVRVMAHVRLAGDIPAEPEMDEGAAANRVAETILAASLHPEIDVVLDTLIEQDRGYFPRAGLLDRRYNLTPPGHVARNLTCLLAGLGELSLLQSSRFDTMCFASDRGVHALVLPISATTIDRLPTHDRMAIPALSAKIYRLGSGVWTSLAGEAEGTFRPILVEEPALITLESANSEATAAAEDARFVNAATVLDGR